LAHKYRWIEPSCSGFLEGKHYYRQEVVRIVGRWRGDAFLRCPGARAKNEKQKRIVYEISSSSAACLPTACLGRLAWWMIPKRPTVSHYFYIIFVCRHLEIA